MAPPSIPPAGPATDTIFTGCPPDFPPSLVAPGSARGRLHPDQ